MSLYHHATNEMKYEAEKRRASDRVKRARKILDVLETFIPESELTPLGVQRHSPWLHSLDPPQSFLPNCFQAHEIFCGIAGYHVNLCFEQN